MKKIYYVLLLFVFLYVFVSCEQTPADIDVREKQIWVIEGESPESIEIKDSLLKECVYRTLGLKDTDLLLKTYVESLKELNCPYEEIKDIEGLQYFKELRDLFMPASRIENISNYFFWRMTKLNSITLSFSNLGYVDGDIFFNLGKLTYLDIKHSGINYIDKDSFYNLKNLKTLVISNNNIGSIGSGFTGLGSLETLIMSDNSIKEVKKEEFSSLVSIRNIIISGNYITDFDPEIFSVLPKLERIDLSGNCLTDEKMEYLSLNCTFCITDNQEPQNCAEK